MNLGMMVSIGRKAAGFLLVLAAVSGSVQAGPTPPSVPEVDPTAVLGAITLVTGGVMLLTDRRRARSVVQTGRRALHRRVAQDS